MKRRWVRGGKKKKKEKKGQQKLKEPGLSRRQ